MKFSNLCYLLFVVCVICYLLFVLFVTLSHFHLKGKRFSVIVADVFHC